MIWHDLYPLTFQMSPSSVQACLQISMTLRFKSRRSRFIFVVFTTICRKYAILQAAVELFNHWNWFHKVRLHRFCTRFVWDRMVIVSVMNIRCIIVNDIITHHYMCLNLYKQFTNKLFCLLFVLKLTRDDSVKYSSVTSWIPVKQFPCALSLNGHMNAWREAKKNRTWNA